MFRLGLVSGLRPPVPQHGLAAEANLVAVDGDDLDEQQVALLQLVADIPVYGRMGPAMGVALAVVVFPLQVLLSAW